MEDLPVQTSPPVRFGQTSGLENHHGREKNLLQAFLGGVGGLARRHDRSYDSPLLFVLCHRGMGVARGQWRTPSKPATRLETRVLHLLDGKITRLDPAGYMFKCPLCLRTSSVDGGGRGAKTHKLLLRTYMYRHYVNTTRLHTMYCRQTGNGRRGGPNKCITFSPFCALRHTLAPPTHADHAKTWTAHVSKLDSMELPKARCPNLEGSTGPAASSQRSHPRLGQRKSDKFVYL